MLLIQKIDTMKIKIIFPIIFSVLFFSSCGEDFFEATVSVDLPEHTPSLAITSEMFAGDSAIAVYVSQSVGILEEFPSGPIKDAKVELFKNGEAFSTLPYLELFEGSKFYGLELGEPFSFEEAEYELKVSAPSFDPVSSKQIMPKAVEIISAEYDEQGAVNSEGDRVDEFTIEFQDPPGEDNYYRLQIHVEDGEFNQGFQLFLENLEPLGEAYQNGLYLKDSSIDGKKYKWRVGNYGQLGISNPKFRIELYSITRDQYLFTQSASLSEDNGDNPFAEPVVVHGNIEGGNGIFSLGTKDVMVIEP